MPWSRSEYWRRDLRLRHERESASCIAPFRPAFRLRGAASAQCRFHDAEALFGHPLATVLGEVGHERRHALEIGAVIDEPALLARGSKAGVCELLQVKRQGGCGHL